MAPSSAQDMQVCPYMNTIILACFSVVNYFCRELSRQWKFLPKLLLGLSPAFERVRNGSEAYEEISQEGGDSVREMRNCA